MKTLPAKRNISGLTLVEVLVVICVSGVLVTLLLSSLTRVKPRRQIQCVANQHQIALGLIIFEMDHAGKLPTQVSITNGGSFELAATGSASSLFQAFAPYLGRQPSLLICSTDTNRHAATNFSELKNANVSYFLNLDATTNATSILTGDRYLEISGKPINSGVFLQTTNLQLHWSDGFHSYLGKPMGGFSFADGHAVLIKEAELNSVLQSQPLATNRLCIP